MAWVYILQCADDSYYTGLTRGDERDQRLSEHQLKLSPSSYTASRLPVRLVYSEYFELVADAIFAERKIKGWSRAKKEALIQVIGVWFKCYQNGAAAKPGPHPERPFEARYARTSG